jgi:hypothetical protein
MKYTLTMYEMIEILDKLNKDAYDTLQTALEQKVCQSMPTEQWLEIWHNEGYEIEMSIKLGGEDNE